MSYKTDGSQLGLLQLLSKHASQNITFYCKNTVAVYDEETQSFNKGMKMLLWNDAELTANGPKRLRYSTVIDECKVRDACEVTNINSYY